MSAVSSNQVVDTLRKFKMHKRDLELRLDAVHEERDDLRHLVSLPMNPRCRQIPLKDSEKDCRLVEIFDRVDDGRYFQKEMAEMVSERILSRLWNINF
ncbi:MAG: hypothetical protein KDC10_06580 [Calditrichaeota bacterium]|nr:hypothetical protein [Candidatus Cloacimonadota bacterium]MCA9785290.1 hypothetical protein [Candidatus Cloacimonadota bacterium]MCB1046851.1 hypothetical protein [Calditrichota bacterium]MCB9474414.1 hypothetical protein [Candidatus Delongbacteria bacterium]